ncbi:Putative branched-chain-amino-acid aminotransferase [Gluconacetobacter sp. SXCC-1]|uniref:Probable branched-chain-amino-acid aminotransferase n=1 Tax=Komagataeibacter rhaeticus TaxID=215221 RepID=A0A181CE96_9PROT|nr:aminotransferase class IV [Komagataeibacter rhaeticus]ATU74028.1 2-keto-4-methylthiobutyrate aminotransferase [Komagataeibacter xylinus]EGG77893.1 Putative branched-chain-amino-acid aminotransferase [Gluconacetobacter sp. SXCC-1]QIP36527.1 2-keto-4-methylthiobutyrate aminotransferase [Komagataeibacter rhaeticus]QOC46299.1 aminotransferase class IV [Komagataeibacter rhaeticus]WPP21041.1 aminotransferase class IV [Komagataeibacter rhaeticus]
MTPSPLPVWLDGRVLAASQARIDPADRGFLLGDGVFETMRVAGGRVCHFARHMDRLARGAAVLHMPPPDMAVLSAGVDALLGACALVSGSLRLTLTRGTGPRGLLPPAPVVPTCLITATAGMPPSTPVRLVTSTHRRDAAGVLSRIKSLNYLPSILARMEAAAQGADDALLLNHAGHVAETSASTLVACMGGQLVTPPVSDGALPGTVRGVLVDAGMVRVGRIEAAGLHEAQALFVLNSLGVREVVALDGHALGRRPDLLAALRACAWR